MPSDAATDKVWDAWMAYQDFEATATGLASGARRADARPHLARLRDLLGQDGVRGLLGDRLPLAEELLSVLEARHLGRLR